MEQTTSYITQVTKLLSLYPIAKVIYEREFPSLVPAYGGERVSGGLVILSPTEKFGIRRAEQAKIIEDVEKALQKLNSREQKLIEFRYFIDGTTDRAAYTYLQWSRPKYYRIKRRALWKIANELNLIH